MSRQAAIEFWGKILREPDVSREAEDALSGATGEKRLERLVELGALHGCHFTAEELAEAQGDVQRLLAGELGEEDLEKIAGGVTLDLVRTSPLWRNLLAKGWGPSSPE